MQHLRIGILSGGAGTRLWPVSREEAPKQFYDLTFAGRPLLADTVARLDSLGSCTLITTKLLEKSSQALISNNGFDVDVLCEPQAKNTGPAIALFTYLSLKRDPDSILAIFPADHIITDLSSFQEAVKLAAKEAAGGKILTIGIAPDHPSDAYGYIELSEKADYKKLKAQKVLRFIEKPNTEKAQDLIDTQKVAWNAGIFVFSAKKMSEAFSTHWPEVWEKLSSLKDDLSNLDKIYSELPKESIDYAIMEKLPELFCVPAELGWSDLGSWEEVSRQQSQSGKIENNPIEVEGRDNHYINVPGTHKKEAVFVGMSDATVVDTPDSLLILRKGSGQQLRAAVEKIKAKDCGELAIRHKFEDRPWGRFEVLLDTEYFKSKRITVLPGKKLSYQSHKKRGEHWIVVKGQAEVTLNGDIKKLSYGDYIHIPLGAKHRIANPGKEQMEFVEVQVGEYFGEDDIIRYEDDYGRS